MKKIHFFPSLACIVLVLTLSACGKDNITKVDTSNTDDDIDSIIPTKYVTISFSENEEATVEGTEDSIIASISGNEVTITNLSDNIVEYDVSGTTSNGFLKIYSGKKQVITLTNATITNTNGAAINIQGPADSPNKGKKTYINVSGTNSLKDGSSYSNTPSTEDEKGTLFGEGSILISGDGSLNVVSQGKSSIVSDDHIRIYSGVTLSVSSTSGHGIKGKDYVTIEGGTISITTSANMKKGIKSEGIITINSGDITISATGNEAYDSEDKEYVGAAGIKTDSNFVMNGGTINITTTGTGSKAINADRNGYFNGGTLVVKTTGNNNQKSAKAIKFDGNLYFNGASVSATCQKHEAIEAKGTIDINSGVIYAYSAADDAINAGTKLTSNLTINGGYVYAYSGGNDGIDANGNLYVKGGVVYAVGTREPEVALDAYEQCKLYIEGGTLITIGGLESGASLTQACYSSESWSANTTYTMTLGSTTYTFKTPSSGGNTLVLSGSSTPTLKSSTSVNGGTAYFDGVLVVGGNVSGGSDVTLSSYSAGGGSGPGGGGHGGGGGGPHH